MHEHHEERKAVEEERVAGVEMAFLRRELGVLDCIERAFGWGSLIDTTDVLNTLHYTLPI